ncbi:MAG: DUF86 domain-containing protein [Geitlerinemataceae cyanobacterium]
MPRDLESLIDIEQAAKRILRFSRGVDRSNLETDEEKISAILYQITIIGEATKRLSPQIRQQYPEIPWRSLAGMRDVIVHEYDQIDINVVWDVVQNKIPELLKLLEPLLPNSPD